jgi:large subunit ribosomal protein L25
MSHSYSAEVRTAFGTKAANELRANGLVPLSIATSGGESVHATVDEKTAKALRADKGRVVEVTLGGEASKVLVIDVHKDAVTDVYQQIDTLRVLDDQMVKVDVPIRAVNTSNSPGLKAGGMLEQMLRKARIQCRSQDIPEYLSANCESLGVAETLYTSELTLPEGARMVTGSRVAVLTVLKTRAMRQAEGSASE